jgi:hypothetical protein
VGIWTTDTSAETLVGMRQLVKTIERLIVMSWPHTEGSVNVLGRHGKMEMLVSWK